MKYLYPILFALLLTACTKSKYTDITGTVKGFTSGTVIIKDAAGAAKFNISIEGGKFHFRQIIDTAGYYTMRIMEDSFIGHRRNGYDVYLEPGTYTITAMPETAHQYPAITSSSPMQNELSAYYSIANQKTGASSKLLEKYTDTLNGKISRDELISASVSLNDALKSRDSAMATALQVYVSKYPQSHVAAHIMYQLNYASNPAVYYPIYQKFTDEQKKSIEGADEGERLSSLMKLMPGAVAPQLVGKTLDGKAFDYKALNKKIILVEFWRADDEVSRANHKNLIKGYRSPIKNKDMAMVSVSLDIEHGVWANAVSDDKITWTQVCDLKGQDSPNVNNWQISKIPTYYLLDGTNWKIIKGNMLLGDVPGVMEKYLKSKPASNN